MLALAWQINAQDAQGVGVVSVEEHALRLAVLERDRDDFKDVVVEIRNSLQSLVRLEERHAETARANARAFDEIKSTNARLAAIERDMPALIEARKLIVGAVCVVLLAVGGGVLALLGLAK